MLFVADAKNCVPLMSKCCLTVSIFVSACRCSMGVVFVQPSMILSAVFCVVCSLFSCVLDMTGAHAGLA